MLKLNYGVNWFKSSAYKLQEVNDEILPRFRRCISAIIDSVAVYEASVELLIRHYVQEVLITYEIF